MRQIVLPRDKRHRFYSVLPAILLAALALDRAFAGDLTGTYPGGAIGRSQVRAAANSPTSGFGVNPVLSGRFKGNDLASAGMLGLPSIPVLGANSTLFPA